MATEIGAGTVNVAKVVGGGVVVGLVALPAPISALFRLVAPHSVQVGYRVNLFIAAG